MASVINSADVSIEYINDTEPILNENDLFRHENGM